MNQTTDRAAARNLMRYALAIGALKLLPQLVQLKSGRMSPYFFNSGLFKTGQSSGHLATAYAAAIQNAVSQGVPYPEVIFGPAYKGVPLAVVTACVLSGEAPEYREVSWCFNRKETKDHGEGGILVGDDPKGKRVAIADDVITAGDAKREAVEIIEQHGGIPVVCVIAFDHLERGRDETDPRSAAQVFSQQSGIPVIAAANLEDLIRVLQDGFFPDGSTIPLAAETLPLILKYRDEYGVK